MIQREFFARTADGETVERFTLTNAHGLIARVITWGATLTELHTPDRQGKIEDITLGFATPEPWLLPHPFFGAIAGRYANRIAKGRFTLDGTTYELAVNNGVNHLHGGVRGIDKRNWQAELWPEANAICFRYTSPDGEEGYPGEVVMTVTYTLTDDNALRVDYEATTSKPTVLNLTSHTFWNLGRGPDILSHELQLHALHYTPVDATSIPTGEIASVLDGAMDFTKAKPIGRDIAALKEEPGGGYDHNWVLEQQGPEPAVAAELYEGTSGRVLRILTTEPGIQFYSGNYLKDVIGKGQTYQQYAGLCLETQHFPDSPNHPNFPTTVLRPGEIFRSATVHQFAVR